MRSDTRLVVRYKVISLLKIDFNYCATNNCHGRTTCGSLQHHAKVLHARQSHRSSARLFFAEARALPRALRSYDERQLLRLHS